MPFFHKIFYKNREQALRKLAFEKDMAYTYKDDSDLIVYLRDFELFRQGRRKRIFHLMTMEDQLMENDFHAFDYYYVVGGGNSTRRIRQTVFFINSKNLALPHFLMKPENFFHKICAFLGIDDINFEEYPDFSSQYLLKGDDEDYIRATFKDHILKYFTVEKDWSLEGINYYMIFYRKNKIIPPDQVEEFINKGIHLFKLLKEHEDEFL